MTTHGVRDRARDSIVARPTLDVLGASVAMGQVGPPPSFEALWRFYEECGFIYPAKREALAPFLEEIEATWDAMLAAGDDLTLTLLRHVGERPRNSLSLVRYTSCAWTVQHLVSRRDPPGVLQLIEEVTSWMLHHPELRYAMWWWRPNNRPAHAIFGAMEEHLRREEPEGHLHRLYDYYLEDVEAVLALPAPTTVQVQSAPGGDREAELRVAVAGLLARHLPEPLRAAEDLEAPELQLASVDERYRRHGLHRRRAVLVALREGQPLAIGTVEHASTGVNFSHLLDKAQIHWIAADTDAATRLESIAALLRAAAEWRSRQGSRHLVLVDAAVARDELSRLGLAPAKQYRCSIVKQRQVPIAFEAVWQRYAPRIARRKRS